MLFITINTIVKNITSEICDTKNCIFMNIPIDIKNIELKIWREGIISVFIWWEYSQSEIATPAIKAPIANEAPN